MGSWSSSKSSFGSCVVWLYSRSKVNWATFLLVSQPKSHLLILLDSIQILYHSFQSCMNEASVTWSLVLSSQAILSCSAQLLLWPGPKVVKDVGWCWWACPQNILQLRISCFYASSTCSWLVLFHQAKSLSFPTGEGFSFLRTQTFLASSQVNFAFLETDFFPLVAEPH